eukprot:Plantae.Rhodophyta-Hildenbrandia_rubra.ctg1192.p2 GENE.Plantae.Rhodophyta-Hildenbrandia_rubra.ctg1192~~Plantae.Rhodophyta-Hildenbrandia_rubra.ctg1192.p2  ORF type:complete len:736 (-),score=138.00 Plantae.Rhodophyta-Hildenbrandia_rubra.ctg1192:7447-9654(-)
MDASSSIAPTAFATSVPLSYSAFRGVGVSPPISRPHNGSVSQHRAKRNAKVCMKEERKQNGQGRWIDVASDILSKFGEAPWKTTRATKEKSRGETSKDNEVGTEARNNNTGSGFVGNIDFSTIGGMPDDGDLTAVDAVIKGIRKVDVAGAHIEIEVDVKDTGLESGHVRPGQFVQMERRAGILGHEGKRAFLTIANAPGRKKSFHFLVAKSSDPAGFTKLKVGEKVRMSPVIGDGVDFGDAISSPNLLLFVDCPQGLAAVRSLLEWNKFRTASGQGANRTTRVKLYYSTSGPGSVAYRSTFSEWMAYGVDVLPIYANTLLDHFGAVDVMREMGHLGNTLAFASVANKDTVEYLYRILSFGGIQRTAIKSFTQDRVCNEIVAFDFDPDWVPPTTTRDEKRYDGVPESFYEYRRMRELEDEIWEEWVKIQDVFRDEAYRRMATGVRFDPFDPDLASNKKQAWSSWFMHNKDEWRQELWDDDVWGGYWDSWTSNREKWASDYDFSNSSSQNYNERRQSWTNSNSSQKYTNWGSPGAKAHWGAAGQSWYEQKSQEYWDWVGRGTQGYGSAGASSERSENRTYEDVYGGSGSWGNENNERTRYEPGGYKYTWDPSGSRYSDTSSSRHNNKSQTGSGTGTGWSGWNRKSNKQTSSSGSNYYSSTHEKVSLKFDFYQILGVENNANKTEIKRAYRRAAMKWHPDRNPNSKEALAKMKEIVVAYTILKDSSKRRDYDVYGVAK